MEYNEGVKYKMTDRFFEEKKIFNLLRYLYLINLTLFHFRLKIIYFPSSVQKLYQVKIVWKLNIDGKE